MFLVQPKFPLTLIFSNSIPSINIIFIYKLYLLLGIKKLYKKCLLNKFLDSFYTFYSNFLYKSGFKNCVYLVFAKIFGVALIVLFF